MMTNGKVENWGSLAHKSGLQRNTNKPLVYRSRKAHNGALTVPVIGPMPIPTSFRLARALSGHLGDRSTRFRLVLGNANSIERKNCDDSERTISTPGDAIGTGCRYGRSGIQFHSHIGARYRFRRNQPDSERKPFACSGIDR